MPSSCLKMLLIFLFSISNFSCISSKAATDQSKLKVAEDIESEVKKIQMSSEMPGLRALVIKDDRVLFDYTSGQRAVEQGVSVEPSDKWHIGSNTKPMTAFLIGRLIDKRQLNWDTKLVDIVPGTFNLHPSLQAVTIDMLLSHSAGLIDMIQADGGKLWETLYTDELTPQEGRGKLVRSLLATAPIFTPGSKVEYSNSAYVILGWIIEQKTKMSWETFIQKELFEPLKMTTCGFGPAGARGKNPPDQPWGHSLHNGALASIAPGLAADNPPAVAPAGTVHCNVTDWSKFPSMIIAGFNGQSNYLTTPTFQKLLTKATAASPVTYASMGRFDPEDGAQDPEFRMAGSNTLNFALMSIAPKRKTIRFALTNSGTPTAEKGIKAIMKLLTEYSLAQ